MTNIEKIALAVTGIECIGILLIGKAYKNAINQYVKDKYGCQNAKEYLEKAEKGQIEMKKR